MAKKIRVWDGTQWQDVAPALPYTAVHSAQASMPSTGIDGQIWLDTDGTLTDTAFVPLSTIDAKGDLLVGTADNTVNKLTAGSNDTVLTADSSTATGLKWSNVRGFIHLNTTTFSAVSSQSITSIFDTTYDNYFITIDYDSSTALDLRMRLRTTSDDTTSNTYQTHALLYGSDGGSLNHADNGTAGYSRWTFNTGTYRAHADMLICGPNLSSVQTNWTGRFAYRANSGVFYDGFWGGNTTTTTQYTGFTFYPSTGTVTGTVRIYGLVNS